MKVVNIFQADHFIEDERLKLYSLLAGIMVWQSAKTRVNVCEQLDWKRCLAIHLWSAFLFFSFFFFLLKFQASLNSIKISS